jgi:hypothetical protein
MMVIKIIIIKKSKLLFRSGNVKYVHLHRIQQIL